MIKDSEEKLSGIQRKLAMLQLLELEPDTEPAFYLTTITVQNDQFSKLEEKRKKILSLLAQLHNQ